MEEWQGPALDHHWQLSAGLDVNLLFDGCRVSVSLSDSPHLPYEIDVLNLSWVCSHDPESRGGRDESCYPIHLPAAVACRDVECIYTFFSPV